MNYESSSSQFSKSLLLNYDLIYTLNKGDHEHGITPLLSPYLEHYININCRGKGIVTTFP